MPHQKITLVCISGKYRFWEMRGSYCVTKGTDEPPHRSKFIYSSLKYLLNVKKIPHTDRP